MLAGAVRLFASGQRGFWYDEYYTLGAARLPPIEMIGERIASGHSPLYFFYAKLGMLLGASEHALRATSALAVSAAVLCCTGLAAALGLRRHLPALWVLMILLPYWVTIGSEYRYMMPVVALTAGTCWAAVRYAQHTDVRRGLLLMLLTGVLLWLNGSAQLVLFGLTGFALWESRMVLGGWSSRTVRYVWPLVLGFLLNLPMLYVLRGYKQDKGSSYPKLDGLVKDLCETVFGNNNLWCWYLNINDGILLPFEIGVLIAAILAAWRYLQRQGRPLCWRFLACLLAGIPLALLLISTIVRDFQGRARYMAAFSVPAVLCLAAAWYEITSARRRKLYRVVLSTLVLVQFSGTALDRGDLHRESVQWIIEHHAGFEPVLLSSRENNELALCYLGFPACDRIAGIDRQTRDPQNTRRIIRETFADGSRGFVLLYHSKAPVEECIRELVAEGFLADCRRWRNARVVLYAVIRDPDEADWLHCLPPPRPWGPAMGTG